MRRGGASIEATATPSQSEKKSTKNIPNRLPQKKCTCKKFEPIHDLLDVVVCAEVLAVAGVVVSVDVVPEGKCESEGLSVRVKLGVRVTVWI